MAQKLNRVQPGDVITADMWNLAVEAINELMESGQTSGITLAATSPDGTPGDPIRIGTLLQITGQNFGFSIGQSSVSFESTSGTAVIPRQNMLAGSSDTRLLLIVPPIPGVPQEGATMTLRVDNGIANDSRSVFVMPVVIPLTGDMFVTWRADVSPNPNPNPIQPLQPATYALQLETAVNMPATFDLRADIQNANPALPAGLVNSIEFRDENDRIISNKRVDMGKSDTRRINVFMPQIPTGLNSFTLQVNAGAGRVSGTFARSFEVGTPVPPSDPDIEVRQTGLLVLDPDGNPDTDPAHGSLEGATIKLKAGFQMIVMYNLTLTQTGNHDLEIQPKAGTTLNGWSLDRVGTPTPIPGTVNDRLVKFGFTPSAGATPTGSVVIRIKRQGATLDWSQEFNVQLLP